MKTFSVSVFFPEVKPAHAAWQSASSAATEIGVAVSRALSEIRERPGIKGKRIKEAQITVRELDSHS
jgi:hypothetical protein